MREIKIFVYLSDVVSLNVLFIVIKNVGYYKMSRFRFYLKN